jgi:hypothetical protein
LEATSLFSDGAIYFFATVCYQLTATLFPKAPVCRKSEATSLFSDGAIYFFAPVCYQLTATLFLKTPV